MTDLSALKELHKAIAMHDDLREPRQNDIDEHYCMTTGEVRFFNACREVVPALCRRIEAAGSELYALKEENAKLRVIADLKSMPSQSGEELFTLVYRSALMDMLAAARKAKDSPNATL